MKLDAKVVVRALGLSMAMALPVATQAGEGGTAHVVPGATATLSDLPGSSPAGCVMLRRASN